MIHILASENGRGWNFNDRRTAGGTSPPAALISRRRHVLTHEQRPMMGTHIYRLHRRGGAPAAWCDPFRPAAPGDPDACCLYAEAAVHLFGE
jgi:hypothetical protein